MLYRVIFLGVASLVVAITLHAAPSTGGKPPLPVMEGSDWPAVTWGELSPDGRFAVLVIQEARGEGRTAVVRETEGPWQRRYRMAPGVPYPPFLADGTKVACLRDDHTLCLIDLATRSDTEISGVASYQFAETPEKSWLVYHRNDSAATGVLRQLSSGRETVLGSVSQAGFSPTGTVLLAVSDEKTPEGSIQAIAWLDLPSGEKHEIWRGKKVLRWVFDPKERALALLTTDGVASALWRYDCGTHQIRELTNDAHLNLGNEFIIASADLRFSCDGEHVFFMLRPNPQPAIEAREAKVDIWNYKSLKLPDEEVADVLNRRRAQYTAALEISSGRVMRVQGEGEELLTSVETSRNELLVTVLRNNSNENLWNPAAQGAVDWVSITDGARRPFARNLLNRAPPPDFALSSDGHWLVWFDPSIHRWQSQDIVTGISRVIDRGISFPFGLSYYWRSSVHQDVGYESFEPPVWLADDKAVILADEFDLWKVDPAGEVPPVNLTRGYGRTHQLRLRLAVTDDRRHPWKEGDSVLLVAFDPQTKENGFYRTVLGSVSDPVRLTMGPYLYYYTPSQVIDHDLTLSMARPSKARNAEAWLVKRQSETEAPNYFFTRDFVTFAPMTDLAPHRAYNWLTTELVKWRTPAGRVLDGVLYKPENFDPRQKYPVIFHYYERRSHWIHWYIEPELSYTQINIPYYVSNGYLVFVPDLEFDAGAVGHDVVEAVVSAVALLAQRPYVDASRLGLQGHSFGGYLTNLLVARTHEFAAAATMAGYADIISAYGGFFSAESSAQWYFERGQGMIGATLWEHPERYVENSPVFTADKVTTPLLMVHNKKDRVPFSGALEFFLGLRRLGKPVWLLQYDNGDHGVGGTIEARDYTIRMKQFFDHYLRGDPPPVWMTQGVPSRLKGAETGYELDRSGAKP